MKDSLEQILVHEALEMAIDHRFCAEEPESLLSHSDRGSQYAVHGYQRRLQERDITCSMSRRSNCWDNAPVESFFATLKKEEVYRQEYLTHAQACFTILKSSTTVKNDIRLWATSAHTTMSNPSLTNCPHFRGNSSFEIACNQSCPLYSLWCNTPQLAAVTCCR